MKRSMLVTERTVTFVTNTDTITDSPSYNGVLLVDTGSDMAEPGVLASGGGIDCTNYYRALVQVTVDGTAGKAGTITAYVGPKGYAADAATPNEAVQVPNWELTYDTDVEANAVYVGEIFLQAVVGNPACKLGANSLWIKHDGDGAPTITVVLEDPATEIADGRNVLQENAVYTG